MHTPSTGPSVLINELELLHAGLGVLIAHYLACDDDGVRAVPRVPHQPPVADHRRARGTAGLGLAAPLPDHGGALAGACDPRDPVSEPGPASNPGRKPLGGGRMSGVLSMGRPSDLACAWQRLRAEEPGVRAREAARKLGTSEAGPPSNRRHRPARSSAAPRSSRVPVRALRASPSRLRAGSSS